MQHAVNVHRLHRGALQRRKQDAAQRIAERLAEATLERFGDQRRKAGRVGARSDMQLVRPDKFLPIFLDRHCFHPWASRFAAITGVGDLANHSAA